MKPAAARWSFEERDGERIQRVLLAFIRDSDAQCALLVDRNGQLILTVGEQPPFDVTAFASLAAADFSANDQLASLLGEQEFSSLFHQGERESMYLADVARRAILVVIFDARATLGMVRIKLRSVVRELNEIFRDMAERAPTTAGRGLESSWADDAEDEIDRLFGGM